MILYLGIWFVISRGNLVCFNSYPLQLIPNQRQVTIRSNHHKEKATSEFFFFPPWDAALGEHFWSAETLTASLIPPTRHTAASLDLTFDVESTKPTRVGDREREIRKSVPLLTSSTTHEDMNSDRYLSYSSQNLQLNRTALHAGSVAS